MNRTHIETFSYQLSPQYYFNRLLKIWLHNNWGWLLSFFLLLVGLSIQNPLFIYVGLIILFLVFPMIISYLWFAYALHPDCRMSILSKTVEINKNGLSCTFDDGRTESIVWERITRIRPREDDLLADSCGAQGAGYRLYHHRPDGYRLHDLLRYSVLTLKEIRKTWN